MSPTTPTIWRLIPAKRPASMTRLPIASTSGKYRVTKVSLTRATGADAASSRESNSGHHSRQQVVEIRFAQVKKQGCSEIKYQPAETAVVEIDNPNNTVFTTEKIFRERVGMDQPEAIRTFTISLKLSPGAISCHSQSGDLVSLQTFQFPEPPPERGLSQQAFLIPGVTDKAGRQRPFCGKLMHLRDQPTNQMVILRRNSDVFDRILNRADGLPGYPGQ